MSLPSLKGLSFAELAALESLAHLALYLTLSKTDPERLQACLQILLPLVEEMGKLKGQGDMFVSPGGNPTSR
jgi:hypothetical protein